ncbi:uncharacterized protein LOC134765232 [Penaeus indicus]|uniref:uncharacterized protein LOC134765232 n=1 Tax=Penaeus indicus TaxID=29960 RepID=UPI00300D80E1
MTPLEAAVLVKRLCDTLTPWRQERQLAIPPPIFTLHTLLRFFCLEIFARIFVELYSRVLAFIESARDAGRRGTGGSQSPPHQLPPPTHGLGQIRPQNGVPQPPQLPTLPPPPIPKQTPKQYNRPSQPHVHPSNPQYLDHPPTEMAPAVPGYTGASAGIGGHPKPGAERVPREDGGMVELTPLYRSIFDRPYFHIISRNKSRELLEKAEDGVFLIRPSTRSSDPLTLCLRYRSRTYNINIRCRPDGLFALGSEKTNEMTFSSVDDIVSTYTREPIKLQSGDRAMLTVPPPKSDHIYVKMPLPKVLGCQ